jgi:hypothetical protein
VPAHDRVVLLEHQLADAVGRVLGRRVEVAGRVARLVSFLILLLDAPKGRPAIRDPRPRRAVALHLPRVGLRDHLNHDVLCLDAHHPPSLRRAHADPHRPGPALAHARASASLAATPQAPRLPARAASPLACQEALRLAGRPPLPASRARASLPLVLAGRVVARRLAAAAPPRRPPTCAAEALLLRSSSSTQQTCSTAALQPRSGGGRGRWRAAAGGRTAPFCAEPAPRLVAAQRCAARLERERAGLGLAWWKPLGAAAAPLSRRRRPRLQSTATAKGTGANLPAPRFAARGGPCRPARAGDGQE